MKLLALVKDTFMEIYSKKAIVGVFVLELFVIILSGLILFAIRDTYKNAVEVGARAESGIEDNNNTNAPHTTDSTLDELLAQDTSIYADSSVRHLDSIAKSNANKNSSDLNIPKNEQTEIKEKTSRSLLENIVIGQLSLYSGVIFLGLIFLGIFLSAGIIPSLMEKGTIDIHLSKPLSRGSLLIGRALGGVVAITLNALFFTISIFIIYGIFTGVWHLPFLIYTFLISIFGFIVIYSFILLLNVITESWILPMSLAYVYIVIIAGFLYARESTLFQFIKTDWVQKMVTGLYYLLPQTSDMTSQIAHATLTGSISEYGFLWQGVIFTFAMLSLAIWKFSKKDF